MNGPRRATIPAAALPGLFRIVEGKDISQAEAFKAQCAIEAANGATLRDQLTEASKDAHRIEWLGAHCPSINRTASGIQVKWWANGHIHGAEGDNLREAVDKAMKR